MPHSSEGMTILRCDMATAYLSVLTCITVWLFWPYFKWLTDTWRVNYQDTFGYLVPAISVWIIARERTKFSEAYKTGILHWGGDFLFPV